MGKKRIDRKKAPTIPAVPPEKSSKEETIAKPEPVKTQEPKKLVAEKPSEHKIKRDEKKPGGITCPRCKSSFVLGENELPKCKICNIELFECSECGTLIDETMRECPKCHALFMGIEREEPSIEKVIQCSSCNFELSDDNKSYACSMCGKSFCDRCLGHHIPPDQNRLEVKVTYQYKFKDSNYWQNTLTKMQWSLPAPLCPDCYEKEFPTGIQRLKDLVRIWKEDQMHEMMIKIVKEDYPQADFVDKMKLVESAHAFLRSLSKKE